MQESYKNIIEIETKEHSLCPFKWDCDSCYKSLCLQVVGVADFPTKYGNFEIIAFTNNKDKKDHIAIVKGDIIHGDNILTRLHSSCLTGDVLGSLRCDCGPQLHKSLSLIEKERLGIILYMQQEGRGIGLNNKIKAYMLQDLGSDTYDANLILGFKPDERQYEIAAAMLSKLDVKSIRLLTNNPNKIKELERFGVKIEKRVSLEIPPNKYNQTYLKTKKTRFKHVLSLGYEE
jgi:GTP cyclohydrolase II